MHTCVSLDNVEEAQTSLEFLCQGGGKWRCGQRFGGEIGRVNDMPERDLKRGEVLVFTCERRQLGSTRDFRTHSEDRAGCLTQDLFRLGSQNQFLKPVRPCVPSTSKSIS